MKKIYPGFHFIISYLDFITFVAVCSTAIPEAESIKYKDPRNQDPKEGLEVRKVWRESIKIIHFQAFIE